MEYDNLFRDVAGGCPLQGEGGGRAANACVWGGDTLPQNQSGLGYTHIINHTPPGLLAEKCVNPDTSRPYTITMLERALRDVHFNVDPKKAAKQQALEVWKVWMWGMEVWNILNVLKMQEPSTPFPNRNCSLPGSPPLPAYYIQRLFLHLYRPNLEEGSSDHEL